MFDLGASPGGWSSCSASSCGSLPTAVPTLACPQGKVSDGFGGCVPVIIPTLAPEGANCSSDGACGSGHCNVIYGASDQASGSVPVLGGSCITAEEKAANEKVGTGMLEGALGVIAAPLAADSVANSVGNYVSQVVSLTGGDVSELPRAMLVVVNNTAEDLPGVVTNGVKMAEAVKDTATAIVCSKSANPAQCSMSTVVDTGPLELGNEILNAAFNEGSAEVTDRLSGG